MTKKKDGLPFIKPKSDYYSQESTRLKYVPITAEDTQLWKVFFENNPTERFIGFENSTKTAEEKAKFWIDRQIKKWNDGAFGQLKVLHKKTDELIGIGGVSMREFDGLFEYEITYSLLPKFWGNGYATELATHFRDYMFTYAECSTVISIIHHENEASINVAEKNNMSVYSKIDDYMGMKVIIFRANQ